MTKAELIKALEPFDDNLQVVIYDEYPEEGGATKLVTLQSLTTKKGKVKVIEISS